MTIVFILIGKGEGMRGPGMTCNFRISVESWNQIPGEIFDRPRRA